MKKPKKRFVDYKCYDQESHNDRQKDIGINQALDDCFAYFKELVSEERIAEISKPIMLDMDLPDKEWVEKYGENTGWVVLATAISNEIKGKLGGVK